MFFFFNDPATTEIYTLSLTTLFRSPDRESHLVDAQPREDPREALELLEREDRGAGQPDVVVFGHAVAAPQVAAVRDREPEARERAGQGVANGFRHATASRSVGPTGPPTPQFRRRASPSSTPGPVS